MSTAILSLDTIYSLRQITRVANFSGQYKSLEIQNGSVDIYSTIRTDAASYADMTLIESGATGMRALVGNPNKIYITKNSGSATTPVVYYDFPELLETS